MAGRLRICAGVFFALLSSPACAQPLDGATAAAALALIGGGALFAGAALLRKSGRRMAFASDAAAASEDAPLRARLDEAEFALCGTGQAVLVWPAADAPPRALGDLSLLPGEPARFETWLAPECARALGEAAAALRAEGRRFSLTVATREGRSLAAEGAPVHGLAALRLRDVSEDRREALRLSQLEAEARAELKSLWAMIEASPDPAWLRGADGALAFVNAAYARAVEARDARDAVARGLELLEKPAREASRAARAAGGVWRARAPAVVAGERRQFDVVEAPAGEAGQGLASAGTAVDVSELQAARDALAREREAHARTLDQLSTAVAIFDGGKRLVFHNAAYRQLWGLDQAFLDERPSDSEILDHLRAAMLIPEQADYRLWKEGLMAAYRALEPEEQAWHLPDGRTLRVFINPNPQGGVTYLYDDLTERFRLESQFNAAIRVQSETLDALKEGVAVFGSDGRLKLFNPAFAELWGLEPAMLGGEPHVDRVVELCAPRFARPDDWSQLRAAVAGLEDSRLGCETRMTRADSSVLDCAAAPLPDGATLVTFIDATAGVNVARALTERNQALVEAERLRNDFVHHVSYELRSPLTNIIGFVQLLGDPAVGPLNERQLEYVGYVNASSTALLAIINDILDLASIDADAMELSREEIDAGEAARAAADAMRDRAAEAGVSLEVKTHEPLGAFVADGKRVRQILTNLLSNAIGFSPAGAGVELVARRRDGEVVFEVIDHGRGVPPEVIDHIFDRFRTHASGSRHRGVGLGLSIARSFVELHGGRIAVDSTPGAGTTVTCFFPDPRDAQGEDRESGPR
ncbi:ATP-binding protein [Methylocella sp.]|uniref:sensor histidine kinase n=1 Tax=Methylocella sp. TaxID=1978226 RepID=UPI003783784E